MKKPADVLELFSAFLSDLQSAHSKGRVRTSPEAWIQQARKVHGGRYFYGLCLFTGAEKKVTVGCPEHGWFSVQAYTHLRGVNCGKCSGNRKKGKDLWVLQAKATHGDKFDYSKVEYRSANHSVTIVCPEHGQFQQTAKLHLTGKGCPKCSHSRRGEQSRKTTASFVSEAKAVHGEKYDYASAAYRGNKKKVVIICKQHGAFEQTPNAHLRGSGCPKCASTVTGKNRALGLQGLSERSLEKFGDAYDFSENEAYIKKQHKLNAKHKLCGTRFSISAEGHLDSVHGGCPKCAGSLSQSEDDIEHFLSGLGFRTEKRNREVLEGKEIDIYLPEQGLAIEYNGDYWHSDETGTAHNYHLKKRRLACEKGVRLIHVYEYLYREKRELVLRMLARAAGVDPIREMARKCKVVRLSQADATEFYFQHHLMGTVTASLHLGLEREGSVVCAASFGKRYGLPEGETEMMRFCLPPELSVTGGMNRLVKHAAGILGTEICHSSVVLDWFTGASFSASGWRYIGDTAPSYVWTHPRRQPVKRWQAQRKHLPRLLGEGFDPTLSEKQNMERAGYRRVWNCGNAKYLLKTKNPA